MCVHYVGFRNAYSYMNFGFRGTINYCDSSEILVVAQPFKFDIYTLRSGYGSYVVSFDHDYQDSNPCTAFIHGGRVLVGACSGGIAQGWAVKQEGSVPSETFALAHSSELSSSLSCRPSYN